MAGESAHRRTPAQRATHGQYSRADDPTETEAWTPAYAGVTWNGRPVATPSFDQPGGLRSHDDQFLNIDHLDKQSPPINDP